MKITVDDKFWVVTDPNEYSVIEDILFRTDLKGLENQIVGANRGGYRMSEKGMTIYSDEGPARQDAEKRLLTIGVINSRLTR